MNYLNRELRHALAAEYVLGTMRGKARDRYNKLMMQHEAMARTTWYWERQLNSLTTALPAQSPSSSVWENITARTIGVSKPASNEKKRASAKPGWPLWGALAATFILAAVFLWARLPTPEDIVPSQVAVFNNQQQAPLWLVEVNDEQLVVKATQSIESRASQDYELWIIPNDESAPVSLGVIPQSGIWKRPIHQLIAKNQVKALAVSLEDKGGSVSGQPAEVLFVTSLQSI